MKIFTLLFSLFSLFSLPLISGLSLASSGTVPRIYREQLKCHIPSYFVNRRVTDIMDSEKWYESVLEKLRINNCPWKYFNELETQRINNQRLLQTIK